MQIAIGEIRSRGEIGVHPWVSPFEGLTPGQRGTPRRTGFLALLQELPGAARRTALPRREAPK